MNNSFARLGIALAAFLCLGWVAAPALADDGVARISVIDGNVTMQHGDSGGTQSAGVNAPLSAGDYLSTGDRSRAEVQLTNDDFVRVSSDAQLRFTHLDPNNDEMQVAAGTVELRVLRSSDANPQIDTPSVSIRPDDAGSYRIYVDSSGNTMLTVRSGRADLLTPQGAQTIESGRTVAISGSSSNPRIETVNTVAYDDFDSWNSQRDQYEQGALNTSYANQNIVGLDDLNANGHWVWVSDYGNAWVPYGVGPDWAPYQDGRWVWAPYYGWTWVAYEPWGWAPYHYGRWFYAPPYGWAWYPGPVYQPAIYTPGAVAFFGFGGGGGFSFGISLAFGNIGWVPLAPGEPFYPWWGRGFNNTTINNINITNINITNININKHCGCRNARAPHGIVAVSINDFRNGSFGRKLPVRIGDLRNVGLLKGTLPIKPTAANIRVTERPVRISHEQPISPRFHTMPVTRPTILTSRATTLRANAAHSSAGHEAASRLPVRNATKTAEVDNSRGRSANAGQDRPSVWSRFAARGIADSSATQARASAATSPSRSNEQTRHDSLPTAATSPWDRFRSTGTGSDRAIQTSRASQPSRQEQTSRTQSSLWSRFNDGSGSRVSAHVRSLEPSRTVEPARTQSASPWDRFGSGSSERSAPRHSTYQAQPAYQGHAAYESRPSYQQRGSYQQMPASHSAAYTRYGGGYSGNSGYSGYHGSTGSSSSQQSDSGSRRSKSKHTTYQTQN